MEFTLEPATQANLIRGYSETQLLIGDRSVERSCIVTPTQLITDWEPASFDELLPGHLGAIFDLMPQVVLLGCGATQRFASADVRREFAQRGIGLEVMQLGAACRTFNVLAQEERQVAAALFLR